jgi:hypothetical protein
MCSLDVSMQQDQLIGLKIDHCVGSSLIVGKLD